MPEKLADWPWVTVRIECAYCPRSGTYRLARLAAKYGADIGLDHVLKLVAFDCPYVDRVPKKYSPGCGVRFTDLWRGNPPPPDLPPYTMRPHLVVTDTASPDDEAAEDKQKRRK